MNYRFQKFTTVYHEFARHFFRNNPGYEHLSYQEQYDRFTETRYSLSNFYAKHMEALGNDAQDLFASLEPLQKAWAKENGVNYGEDTWFKDIVIAQVKAFQPDVLYLEDLYVFDQSFRHALRGVCKKRVIMVGARSAPTSHFTEFRDLDVVISAAPHFVKTLRQNGANAVLVQLGFEDTILELVAAQEERDLDFTFVGSVVNRNGYHRQRYAMIEQLMSSSPLQVWAHFRKSHRESARALVRAKAIYGVNTILGRLGISTKNRANPAFVDEGACWAFDPALPSVKERYPKRVHEPVFGLENYEILARSKVGFNCHIDVAEDFAGNMRLYEVTGMGTCLLTDWKVNLPELFEPDVEVVTYRSADECIEKVRYLLDHEDDCRAIGAAGQQRTLRDHTYRVRVQQLDDILRKYVRLSR